MGGNPSRVLILISGGIDSTACIKYYQDLGFKVEGFFVDYGQKARLKECQSVEKIADYYKINSDTLTIHNTLNLSSGEIRGRNGFLIMAALLAKPDFSGLLSLGIHRGVPYYDCSKEFIKKMNGVVTEYSDGQIKIDTPFIDWDKKMIVSYCRDSGVPIHLTYSCETGDEPCGKCLSCLDRSALNVC
ncbi:7-cyano-7-deazaguanine synthase [Methanoregula sp. PtaB.Bin085]|uniref:7-cyano-7-deazaguanine synthase n=1 Tax=Methanoregula sp. PtaB.Bin085 TaxID=1811680 RepID=UPI0009D62A57|nr:7-cyano-7-deazaguanine synthase [Methanoregula sp. PtaB.Bin085]OPX61895.1 MAG: queuosine biosynthesis protein QueC [Methanoregula sp. PtaB.Bin085]